MKKKIIITGMTAPQSSPTYNSRKVFFAGALSKYLENAGFEVKISQPSISITKSDVGDFDYIFVGVSPILSVSANYSFGALSLIDSLKDTGKLFLFIDAPEPGKIFASLRSVHKQSFRLYADIYQKRDSYKIAKTNKAVQKKILNSVDFLLNSQWPVTFYPALPWMTDGLNAPGFLNNASSSCVGVHVDSLYINSGSGSANGKRRDQWVVDDPNTKWSLSTKERLINPIIPMKESRSWDEDGVFKNISESIGSLIGPKDDNFLWWSTRFFQSLNHETPIATDWKLSSRIGSSWTFLPTAIESMSLAQRYDLACNQKSEYINALDDIDTVSEKLREQIGE